MSGDPTAWNALPPPPSHCSMGIHMDMNMDMGMHMDALATPGGGGGGGGNGNSSASPPVRQIVRGIGAPKAPSVKAKEAQRARRSEIERLSRQRRNGQTSSMRAELARLEQLQAQLLLAQEADPNQTGEHTERPHQLAVRDPPRKALRQQYVEAVREARRLREQQSSLHDMLHENTLRSSTLQQLAREFADEEMVTWDQAITAWFDPLRMSDALAVMKECSEAIARFDTVDEEEAKDGSRTSAWESSGGQFMGWRDKRKLDPAGSTMMYCFTKHFPHEDAHKAMETTWTKFCQETFFQKTIVNASTELQIQVLQQLSDSIRVARRRTKYPAMGGTKFQTVYLQFRMETENGFVICFKTIRAPEVERALDEDESWVEIFQWTSFQRSKTGSGGCEISFGGSLGASAKPFMLHWLIESILAVVRWECACVAPLFLLPPQGDA